mmetsp:Transcript_34681/g.60983  ORF Transcript_34681/g.60983 Transcript_34681/m.60983 type:complete len:290 (+) Transcript_34681:683-1552(+)
MNDFYELDLDAKHWHPIIFSGPAPSPRYFHSSVVYGDRMYLFGGYSGHERLHDLYEFSFEKLCWKRIDAENAPSGRSSLVAQVYSQCLYIFGGYNGTLVLNDFYEFRFDLVCVPQSSLVQDLRSMINEPMFSDLILRVEGQEVHANRALLGARSEFFKAMLFSHMLESTHNIVEIGDISFNVFMIVLHYLYTDQLCDLSLELAVPLLVAADRFMLERLKALCQEHIRKSINHDNVIVVLRTCFHHSATQLKEICLEYISANISSLKLTSSFQELRSEPDLLMEIMMRIR